MRLTPASWCCAWFTNVLPLSFSTTRRRHRLHYARLLPTRILRLRVRMHPTALLPQLLLRTTRLPSRHRHSQRLRLRLRRHRRRRHLRRSRAAWSVCSCSGAERRAVSSRWSSAAVRPVCTAFALIASIHWSAAASSTRRRSPTTSLLSSNGRRHLLRNPGNQSIYIYCTSVLCISILALRNIVLCF